MAIPEGAHGGYDIMIFMVHRTRPLLIVGHRGDPAHAPENTLASVRSAIAKGAKAVEVDVRRSSDGVWIAFHDSTLQRITGHRGNVARVRWRVLRSLDAGGDRIPRITEVLNLCGRRGVRVILDVKVRDREKELFRILQRSGWLDRVIVGAGTLPTLKRWRRLLTVTPLFWVTGFRSAITPYRVNQARRLKLTGLLAYRGWVTQAALQRAHRSGLKLYVWTVRTPAQLKRFVALGVDGIMNEIWPLPSI